MQYITANWKAPHNIRAITTTREVGASKQEYAYNNLGLHVNDSDSDVITNRKTLRETLLLQQEPFWLNQTHTDICTVVTDTDANREADAAITQNVNIPLVIMTADCVPIVLCNQEGTEIAAIHAGWKGLLNGIITNTVAKLSQPSNNYIAWVGPAICGKCYATGDFVAQQFIAKYDFSATAFQKKGEQIFANLPQIAELILNKLGVKQTYLSNACTYEENDKFYSYRRQAKTGRMATLIWFQEEKL